MSKIHFLSAVLKLFSVVLVTGICFFLPQNAFAQQTISGKVRDAANGAPLSGATIAIKGGSKNTVSDANGVFTIAVADNKSILTISYVGYVTQDVPAGTGDNLEITLQPSSAELNQVVVVGYGTQRKKI
ncbi:MAG: carboxypeptidase-like regulatory domain-containing protein [Bacteroidota bacterium]